MFHKLKVAIGDWYVEGHVKEVRRRGEIVQALLCDEALSCRKCDALGIPVLQSRNKYRCIKCGNQFSGAPHRINETLKVAFENRPPNLHPSESGRTAVYASVVREMSKK